MTSLDASAQLLTLEAHQRGLKVFPVIGKNLLQISDGDTTIYTCGSRSSVQSSVGLTIADRKHYTRAVLGSVGLPIAKGGVIRSETDIRKLASTIGFPVVLKPVDGRHGQGVKVGLNTLEDLIRTYQTCGYTKAIVEEMASGKDYRVVVVNNKFIAATYRVPAYVVGDGTHTLEELVSIKNQDPRRGIGHTKPLTKIVIDTVVISNLDQQGYTTSSIIDKDQTVFLRKTANLSTGGEGWDVTDEVCEENRHLFEQVAQVADLLTVGIDVIAPDLTTPLSASGGVIIEINASPGLRMHHYPAKGQPRNVAGAILNMVFGTKLYD